MNTITGISFYDALTKLTIGFLITFWWLPEIINCGSNYCSCGVSLNAVQTFLYGILCFIAGFVWEAVYNLCGYVCKKIVQHLKISNEKECNPRNAIKLYLHDLRIFLFYNTRNNEEWIERAKKDVEKERKRNTIISYNYYMAYYQNVNIPIGSVKPLEAHEAFLRNIIFVSIIIAPLYFGYKYDCQYGFIYLIITYVFDFIFFYIWRKIQFKIHKLVWEADYYNEKQK